MSQKDSLNFKGGFKKGEMQIIASPTGRMKSRLLVNLPGDKETIGVLMPEMDFSALEERVAALQASSDKVIAQTWPVAPLIFSESDNLGMDELKAVTSLMREADRCISFQRSKAKPGDTYTVYHMRGRSKTFRINDDATGLDVWEDIH